MSLTIKADVPCRIRMWHILESGPTDRLFGYDWETKYQLFDIWVAPRPSVLGKDKFQTTVVCPHCGQQLQLFVTQGTFAWSSKLSRKVLRVLRVTAEQSFKQFFGIVVFSLIAFGVMNAILRGQPGISQLEGTRITGIIALVVFAGLVAYVGWEEVRDNVSTKGVLVPVGPENVSRYAQSEIICKLLAIRFDSPGHVFIETHELPAEVTSRDTINFTKGGIPRSMINSRRPQQQK